MSFLAPLFLLGGLAISLPVLFHLTRRSTRRRQVFSTLMFLRPTPPRLTRRNRVEHVLLLLLRCAVIGLLAFAFARPFFRQPAAVLPQVAPPQRWVVLLDTSASMRRDGLWAGAESEFRQVLEALGPGDELAVMTFDRQVRTILPFDRWRESDPRNRAILAMQQFEATRPGWAGTRLDVALMAAAELLGESEALSDETVTRQIHVITDLQSGAELAGIQGYAWPDGVEILPRVVRASHPGNAGLQWLVSGDADLGGGPVEPVLRLRITSADDSPTDQFEIRWGESSGEPMRVQVPPGQSRVFGLPRPEGVAGPATLRLVGDHHEFDNRIHTLADQVTERRVWFWTDDAGDDPKRLGYYLARAFPNLPRRKTDLLTVKRDEEWRANGDGELVIATGRQSAPRIAAARSWVSEGGTLLWVLDSTEASEGLRLLLDNPAIHATEAAVEGYALLEQIDFRHPLFAPFADPRYSDFTKIHFWRHRRLEPGAIPGASILARFDNGDPALVEVPVDQGRVLVLTVGWHPADGQLALSSKFVPWLHAMVEYASSAPPRPSQHLVGDTVDLPASEAAPVRVTLPDDTEVETTERQFRATTIPGVYRASQGTNAWQFAVNLDPAETRTSSMVEDELERLGIPLRTGADRSALSPQRIERQQAAEVENRQKLWRWMILGALAIVGLESWVAGRLTRGRATEAPG